MTVTGTGGRHYEDTRWPSSWRPPSSLLRGGVVMPERAVAEWRLLARALEALDGPTPCQSRPVAEVDRTWFSLAEESKLAVAAAVAAAREGCAGCPVVRECAAYALAAREEYGVWGGLTAWQRRDLLSRASALVPLQVPNRARVVANVALSLAGQPKDPEAEAGGPLAPVRGDVR